MSFFFGLTNLALVGFPFLSGFFSKDLGLEFVLSGNLNSLLRVILLLSVTLTVCYSVKFILLGRLEFTNYGSVSRYNLISKISFTRLIALVFLRVWFGFFYFIYLLDSPIMIDLSGLLKLVIILLIYYIYFFVESYVQLKEIYRNNLSRRARTLFFLRGQSVLIKTSVAEFV